MSKEYYKNIINDLRARIQNEKESKKRDSEFYARMMKNATLRSSKDSYRKQKIDRAASHDRTIESLKKQIERAQELMKMEK